MRRSEKENSFGAEEGRGINAHPNPKNKNLGGETSKKRLAVILSAVLVISMMTVMPAIASDWHEFQKDELNIGRTNDAAPTSSACLNDIWHVNTPHGAWSGIDTVPVTHGDFVYVLSASGSAYLSKYYKKNGTAAGGNWPVAVGSGGYQNSCPAYGEGKIFVLNSGDHTLYAVNATTGSKTSAATGWNTNPVTVGSYQLSCPLTYHNDGGTGRLFFGDCQGSADTYYCYFANNGTQAWSYAGAGKNYWAGAAVIGDYIVFGNDSDCVTSLHWSDGSYADSLDVATLQGGTARQVRSSIAWNATNSTYGHVFFTDKTSSPNTAYAWKIGFNKSTGELVPSDFANSSNLRYSTSTPAIYKGRVYVGGGNFTEISNHYLHALGESDLTTIWSGEVNGAVQSSPAISTYYDDGDGEIYLYVTTNCGSGRVYCFKDYAGNSGPLEQWFYESVSSNKYMLAGAAISGGMVFAGDDGGELYGLGTICGDVDCIGGIQFFDCVKLRKHYYEGYELNCLWAGDVDCIGGIQFFDCVKLRKHYYEGYELHCCE